MQPTQDPQILFNPASAEVGFNPLQTALNIAKQNSANAVNSSLSPDFSSSNSESSASIAPNSFPSNTSWDEFVKIAKQVAEKNHYPLSVLLGQAALETGHGSSGLNKNYNNYFGIKGEGPAGAVSMPTQEQDANGNYHTINSNFRVYNNPAQSVQDYIDLILNSPRYSKVHQDINNPTQVIQDIKDAGYATSQKYVQNVVNTPEFQTYQ